MVSTNEAKLGRIVTGGVAEAAGLLVGDQVIAVNAKPVADWAEFVSVIKGAYGLSTDLMVERAGVTQTITVIPETRQDPMARMAFWEWRRLWSHFHLNW